MNKLFFTMIIFFISLQLFAEILPSKIEFSLNQRIYLKTDQQVININNESLPNDTALDIYLALLAPNNQLIFVQQNQLNQYQFIQGDRTYALTNDV